MKKALVLLSALLGGCVSPDYCEGYYVHKGKCAAAVAADVVLVPLAVVGVTFAAMGEAMAQAERESEARGDITCNYTYNAWGNVSGQKCVRGQY